MADAQWWGANRESFPVPSGLVLQLDGQLITTSGSAVTAWPDLSGLGNHGVQGTPALQGTREATGWNGSYPCVLLNGETSGHHLTFDTGIIPSVLSGDDAPYTITWLAQVTQNPAGERYFWSAGNSGSANPWLFAGLSSLDFWLFSQRDNVPAGTGNVLEAASTYDTNRHQFTLVNTGTVRTLYKDGAQISTATTNLGVCTYDRFTYGRLRRTAVEEGINFRTPGMQIHSRALSAPELALLWQYNRDHFGGLP